MSALSVRGLRKSYDGAEVVSGLDLAVAAGECFGLLGPNGAVVGLAQPPHRQRAHSQFRWTSARRICSLR